MRSPSKVSPIARATAAVLARLEASTASGRTLRTDTGLALTTYRASKTAAKRCHVRSLVERWMRSRLEKNAETDFDWSALWIVVLGTGALLAALNALWSL